MSGPVRVCGVQFDSRLGDAEANTDAACRELRAAVEEGARLVVFPEATLTGYVYESRDEALAAAVDAGGPELAAVADTCRSLEAFAAIGAVERDGETLHNAAFLVGPKGLVGHYRKVHTLCLGVDRFTTPGAADAVRVFELPFGRVGLNICYDGTFPETGRVLKLLGAQLILLPTNWPTVEIRPAQVRIRAWENHVNYFAVNRVGTEGGVEFRGGSVAAGPRGELLALGDDRPGRIHVDFDLPSADRSYVVAAAGEYEFDYIADRRPDCYRPISDPSRAGGGSGSRQA